MIEIIPVVDVQMRSHVKGGACAGCEKMTDALLSSNEAGRVLLHRTGMRAIEGSRGKTVSHDDALSCGAEPEYLEYVERTNELFALSDSCHDGGVEVHRDGTLTVECGAI